MGHRDLLVTTHIPQPTGNHCSATSRVASAAGRLRSNAESSKWLPGGTCPGTGLLPLVNFNRRTGLRGSCRDQNSVQLRDNWRARILLIFRVSDTIKAL